MGCTTGKSQPSGRAGSSSPSTLKSILKQLETIIFKVESLNRLYLRENEASSCDWDSSFGKTEQFIKNAYEQARSDSEETLPSVNKQSKLPYEDYAIKLQQFQVASQQPLLGGFLLFKELQSMQKTSSISQTLIDKLWLVQHFALKVQVPLLSHENLTMVKERELQQIVKELSTSMSFNPSNLNELSAKLEKDNNN